MEERAVLLLVDIWSTWWKHLYALVFLSGRPYSPQMVVVRYDTLHGIKQLSCPTHYACRVGLLSGRFHKVWIIKRLVPWWKHVFRSYCLKLSDKRWSKKKKHWCNFNPKCIPRYSWMLEIYINTTQMCCPVTQWGSNGAMKLPTLPFLWDLSLKKQALCPLLCLWQLLDKDKAPYLHVCVVREEARHIQRGQHVWLTAIM